MKVVLEFGIRGGYHVDNLVIPSAKLAAKLAAGIINTLDSATEPQQRFYTVSRRHPRVSWTSSEHFVSVTVLDGIQRGPASANLWRKP